MRLAFAFVLTLAVTSTDAQTVRRRAVAHPGLPITATPQTVILTPSRDTTLYETPDGSLSNGSGEHLFAGATGAAPPRRRALLLFDLAARVPPGSLVTRVELRVSVTRTISGPQPLALHAMLADWGEGASNANRSQGGDGAAAAPGDATWLHRFFPSQRWSVPGGDFTSQSDAATESSTGPVLWEGTRVIARVQQWVDQPASNFGWIVIGNESAARTAKRFASRESTGATSPSLTVEFIPRR